MSYRPQTEQGYHRLGAAFHLQWPQGSLVHLMARSQDERAELHARELTANMGWGKVVHCMHARGTGRQGSTHQHANTMVARIVHHIYVLQDQTSGLGKIVRDDRQ